MSPAVALPLLLVLAVLALAWSLPDPPRDPDEAERGATTILPEDR